MTEPPPPTVSADGTKVLIDGAWQKLAPDRHSYWDGNAWMPLSGLVNAPVPKAANGMRRGWMLAIAAVVVIAVAAYFGRSLFGPDLSPSPLSQQVGGLVTAEHDTCGQQGQTVAGYLQNGSPTSLDPQYAGMRSSILSQPSDARPGLIRQQADAVITACDRQLDQQAAAQAKAQADAQAAAAQASAQADAVAHYANVCRNTYHGYIRDQACEIDYPGDTGDPVAIKFDGTWDQAAADTAKKNCAQDAANAQAAANGGYPWSRQPVYHPDTGVCVLGFP